jgi:transposase
LYIEELVTISTKEYDRLLSLELLVLQLQEEIRLLKNGKKSSTSHTTPSHDTSRSNTKSLREKSEKKSGGQLGHEGSTLRIKAAADKIIPTPNMN